MAFQVVFKKRFINKLVKVQTYLENEWGDKVARHFLNRIDERINLLKKFPNLGAASEKIPGLRGLLITKHNILYYKVENHIIFVVNLYDTRSQPLRTIE